MYEVNSLVQHARYGSYIPYRFWLVLGSVDGLIGSDGFYLLQFSSLDWQLIPHISNFLAYFYGCPVMWVLHFVRTWMCYKIFLLLDLLSPIVAIGIGDLSLLIHASQVFMSFQWDVLLVEYGFSQSGSVYGLFPLITKVYFLKYVRI